MNDDDVTPLEEARMWARHGYEIAERAGLWSDHGVAPAWLIGRPDGETGATS